MGAGISAKESLSTLTEAIPNLGLGAAFHCAMIGLDSAGKTTVLYRLKFNQYVNTAPTIGFNCEKVRVGGYSFLVWDVGGQEKLRPLWRSYTRATDGIIFVVDSCKEERLEEAKLELLKICKSTGGGGGKNPHVPVLVLANKQDLPVAVDPARLEALLGLKELGTAAWHLQPTCAITGDGLEEGMGKLRDMIVRRRKLSKSSHNLAAGFGAASSSSAVKPQKSSRKLQRSHSHHC